MKKRKYEIVEGEFCGTCAHYHQHYTNWGQQGHFHALSYGHCSNPRYKRRAPDQTCPLWKPKARNE